MIPFSPPRIDQQIIDEVIDTLKSGWITTGPKTKLFEKRLTEFNGNQATLCVSSATAGLEIILRWLGVKEGDEVIVPAYTYCATANVVIHCGAKPVLVDVNDDFNISLENIRKNITSKTKVIMPVDIAGFPCDYDEINALVKEPDIIAKFNPQSNNQKTLGRILILSDAAHSIGASYKGKKTGSLTDVTVFSFHAVKNLTTAEGGAIALNLPNPFDNEAIYQKLYVSILHGQNKDALAKSQKGNWQYDIVEAGFKANMTDIQASLGLIELQRYENDHLVKRRAIFDAYSKTLGKYKWANIPVYQTKDKTSSYHVYTLRINGINEDQRNAIIQEIFNQDVSVNVHFKPLPLFTFYKNAGYSINDYPQSFKNYSQEISLPVYYDLTNEQVNTVIQAVINAVKSVLND